MAAERVAAFRGPVLLRRELHGPLGLVLTGRSSDHPDEELGLAFAGSPPADLPERLEDVVVERGGEGEYRIVSPTRAWPLAARSVHLHREVADSFYRAIPPRPAPLLRRMLFAIMLAIARSRAGIAVLRTLRR